MTSAPTIVGNRIRNTGDKGISVGEASDPIIFANVIQDSVIGIEIKDRSSPIILNCEIRGSGVGLGSHVKNWRYGSSGLGFIANTLLKDNETAFDGVRRRRDIAADSPWGGGTRRHADGHAVAGRAAMAHRRLGSDVEAPRLGVPASWRTRAPAPPIEEFRFVDDLESVADGWAGESRMTRLEKRRGVLVVEVEGGTSAITRDVSWDLTEPGGALLVMELAGRDIQQVWLDAEGERGRVSRAVGVASDPSRFVVAELPLPADRYHRVTVRVAPTPGLRQVQRSTGLSVVRAARLLLRSVAAYPVTWQG